MKKIPFAISPDVIYNLSPLLIATHATSNNQCTRDPVTNLGSISDVYTRKGRGEGAQAGVCEGVLSRCTASYKGKRSEADVLPAVARGLGMLNYVNCLNANRRFFVRLALIWPGPFLRLDYDSLNLVCWRRPRGWDAPRPVLVVGALTNAMLIVFLSLANNISNLLPLVFASVLRYDALKCIYDVPCIPVTFGM